MTHQIRITDGNGNVVKAFSFDTDETEAYDVLSETAGRYPADHTLNLMVCGHTVTDGRCRGHKS